ncbi:NRDE family protein [Duganella aceris]|uniref:NRDE family protein n=1 Tax=Duganella aceris TaxID=2703883 RepID=UPI003531530A
MLPGPGNRRPQPVSRQAQAPHHAGRHRRGGPSRFAAITNIRAPSEHRDDAPSRGHLVADYLAGGMSPQEYVDSIREGADAYNGFNLVLGDRDTLIWFESPRVL